MRGTNNIKIINRPFVRPSAWKKPVLTRWIFTKFGTSMFWKSAGKIQVSLKSDKNDPLLYMKTHVHYINLLNPKTCFMYHQL